MKKIANKKNKTIGKIIVIDGIDGSGKKTQTELLVKRIEKEITKRNKIGGVVRIDFPQYEKNFFGKLLKESLSKEEYKFLQTHPKIASVVYAADRWESLKSLNKYLELGYIIILDRYVSSNQIHQGGKLLENAEKRTEFMTWLNVMEHKVFNLPKPNLILYLSLELSTIQGMLKARAEKNPERVDLVDKDFEYQRNSRESALKLSTELKNMKVVNCDNGENGIKSVEEIHEEIYNKIKKLIS